MAADEIHVGDIGTVITLDFYDGAATVDISAATVAQMIFEAPDGTAAAVAATLGPANYQMHYHTLAGTFDEAGEWSKQGYVEFGGGTSAWHSDVHPFTVFPNLI